MLPRLSAFSCSWAIRAGRPFAKQQSPLTTKQPAWHGQPLTPSVAKEMHLDFLPPSFLSTLPPSAHAPLFRIGLKAPSNHIWSATPILDSNLWSTRSTSLGVTSRRRRFFQ